MNENLAPQVMILDAKIVQLSTQNAKCNRDAFDNCHNCPQENVNFSVNYIYIQLFVVFFCFLNIYPFIPTKYIASEVQDGRDVFG